MKTRNPRKTSTSHNPNQGYPNPRRRLWHFFVFAWILAFLTASPLHAQGSAVPGTIEAESFSAMSGVQTEGCSEGGLNVGYIDSGDWMDYAINPSTAGGYNVELRVAGSYGGGAVRIMSGATELATIALPATGGWQNWTTVSSTLNLAAGSQTLRLEVVSPGWNINWMKFTSLSGVFFPAGSGIINVRDHGAVGDGVADDTQAIRNSIYAASAGVGRVIYLPDGTYKVSDTIHWTTPYERYLTLQGQSKNGTVIKLVDNAAAFQSTASPKAVISTLRSSSNLFDSFRNYIRNLTVDVGQGNAGAVGIDYLSNNAGGIYDVNIRSSDVALIGHCGLRMPMAGPGPSLVKNVRINGFDTGIWATDTHVCVTFEHIQLSNQRALAIRNDKNSLTFRDLISQNSVPVIESLDERGFVQIISGTFSGGSATATAITSPLGMLHLRDVDVSGYGNAVSDRNGILPIGAITEYLTHAFRSRTNPAVRASMRLPIAETPDVPWDALGDWTFVTSYGAVSSDSGKQPFMGGWTDAGDDSAAIQAAIDSGKTTVCFPNGIYNINNTIYIRSNVRRIIGLESTLQAGATLASSGAPMFVFEDGTSPVVVFERFDADYGGISGPYMLHNSTRTLVLQSITALGSPAYGYYNYQTGTGTGDLFVEDSIIRISIRNQRAWMRQYNSETVSLDQITPHLINDGGTVFILGMKTEGVATQIETKNGGRTEVLGGLLASTNYIQPNLPGIINNESQVCVVAPTYIDPAAQQEWVVSESIGGVNRTLGRGDFPNRSSSEYQWWTQSFGPAGNWYVYGGGYAAPGDDTYSAVPGTIEAENFSNMSGVQTGQSSEGTVVGWLDAGDWMDFGINPSAAGAYTVELRVASLPGGGTVRVMSGPTVLTTLTIPGTGGWDNWITISSTVNLTAGNQYIWLDVASGGWNINWMRFKDPSAVIDGVWISLADGVWSQPGNWQNGDPANGADMTATFNQTTGATITLDSVRPIGNLVFGSSNYILSGGTLALTSTSGISNVSVATGTSAFIGSVFTGASHLNKTGDGTLILSNTNSYSGATTVAAGTLWVASGTSTPVTIANAGFESPVFGAGGWSYSPSGANWSFNGSGCASNGSPWVSTAPEGMQVGFLQNNGTLTQSITVTNGGFYDLSFQAANRPNYADSGIAVQINSTTVKSWPTGTFASGGAFQTFVVRAVRLEAGSNVLTFVGSQNGADSATAIDNVRLTGYPAGSLPTGTALTLSGGTLRLDVAQTVGSLVGVSGTQLINNVALTVGSAATTTFAGVISGTGSLVKDGSGTLTLTGNNTYTGGTTVAGGKLIVSGSLNNTSSVTIATGAELELYGTLATSGNIVNSGTLVLTGSAQLSAGGTITNNGTLINRAPGYTLPANLVNNGTIYNLPAAPAGLSATAGDVQVALSWSAVAGASSYQVKQSAFAGGPYTTIATPTGTTHTATGLTNGAIYYFVVSASNTAGESANSVLVSATPQALLPLPRLTMDIGNVGLTGSAVFSGGTFTLQGAGTGITGTADACRFVYQMAGGDCSATIRVQSPSTTGSGTKVGVMIRESLAANAREAGVWVSPASGILFTRRTSTGGTTAVTASTGKTAPYWVRLTRTGNVFKAFYSPDGSTWIQFGSNRTISMATTTYIGIATTSGTTATLCTGVLTNESVAP